MATNGTRYRASTPPGPSLRSTRSGPLTLIDGRRAQPEHGDPERGEHHARYRLPRIEPDAVGVDNQPCPTHEGRGECRFPRPSFGPSGPCVGQQEQGDALQREAEHGMEPHPHWLDRHDSGSSQQHGRSMRRPSARAGRPQRVAPTDRTQVLARASGARRRQE